MNNSMLLLICCLYLLLCCLYFTRNIYIENLSNIENEFYHFTFNDYADVNKFSECLIIFLHTIFNMYFPFRTKSISCRRVTLGSSLDYQRNLENYETKTYMV